jgi:hypothetical protein
LSDNPVVVVQDHLVVIVVVSVVDVVEVIVKMIRLYLSQINRSSFYIKKKEKKTNFINRQ